LWHSCRSYLGILKAKGGTEKRGKRKKFGERRGVAQIPEALADRVESRGNTTRLSESGEEGQKMTIGRGGEEHGTGSERFRTIRGAWPLGGLECWGKRKGQTLGIGLEAARREKKGRDLLAVGDAGWGEPKLL